MVVNSGYICSINNRYCNFALNYTNSITLSYVILNLLICSSISSISSLMHFVSVSVIIVISGVCYNLCRDCNLPHLFKRRYSVILYIFYYCSHCFEKLHKHLRFKTDIVLCLIF